MTNKKYKILIVDDNNENIKIVGSVLRKANYQIGIAFDGQQALDVLRGTAKYDLVLLDVNMPVMDGFETCKQIRKDKDIENIPILFLTALNEMENIVMGFGIGGQDYISKPFDPKELLARVKTHIELRSVKKELKQERDSLEDKVKKRTDELRSAYQQLQELNRELKAANAELEYMDQVKVDFLSIISHEINTPLNGIIGFTNILKQKNDNEEFDNLLGYLEASAQRLENFAQNSLLITELRTHSKKINKSKINLYDLVNELISSYSEQKIRTIFSSQNNDSEILADHQLLSKALSLLFNNSFRYTPIQNIISVYIQKERDNYLSLIIEDNGLGFPDRILNSPFKYFENNSDKYHDGSTGLGLALVKLIMDVHSAKINLSNREQGGAKVKLTFKEKI